MNKLFNTLTFQIHKNLKESIFQNEVYKSNQWAVTEKQILAWSTRYRYYTLLLIIAFVLWVTATYCWRQEVLQLLPRPLHLWKSILDWPIVVFAGQLTIIGVIFPIVVGFIGQLLKDRSANRALWDIFSHYSGFMFAGFSGLMLAAVILLGQFTRPWQSHSFDVVFAIGICIWFLFNLILTGWFLRATFVFVGTEGRSNLIMRYCINQALIFEIRQRLAHLIPMQAVNMGLLDKNIDGAPQVQNYFFHENAKLQSLEIEFTSPRVIADIRFRLLNLAILAWKKAASTSQKGNEARLILPFDNLRYPKKKWTLASATDGKLNFFTRLLIQYSYKFKKDQTVENTSIGPTIQALVGNIEDALRERNWRLFELAIDEMVQWHSDLMNAASFINDSGNQDNWLLLGDGSFFRNKTILQELSGEYLAVNRAVVQLLPHSDQYFHTLCYFPLNIYSKRSGNMAGSVVMQLLDDHYRIWIALMDWHHDSTVSKRDSISNQQHESAIKLFVGSWESWATPRLSLQFDQWSQCSIVIAPYIHHLELTAQLLITALRNNEQSGAEWAADMLLRWKENMLSRRESHHHFYWKQEFIVPFLLGVDKTNPMWELILQGNPLNEADALAIALENSWCDVRLMVAVYILNRPHAQPGDIASQIVDSLLSGKRPRATGDTDDISPIGSGRDILQAYMRHRWVWRFDVNQHAQWLDKLVSTLGRIEAQEMVAGRVYSGWGSDDISSLENMYMAVAISRSNSEWELSSNNIEFILSDVLELQHREHLIRMLKAWLTPTEVSVEKARSLVGVSDITTYLDNFRNSIAKAIEQVENKNLQDICTAPIDNERLSGLGIAASVTAFTKNSRQLPLCLFSEISYVDHLGDEVKHVINIGEYQRAAVATGINGARAINESEWLDRVVVDNVSLNLYRSLIQSITATESEFDENSLLLSRAIADASGLTGIGLKPILLIGPWSIYSLLDSLLWGYGRQGADATFDVRKDDGYPEDYVCHLNNVEVYRMPFTQISFCLLVPKECFHAVRIRKLSDEQFVKADFIENEVDKTKGTLQLSYWLEVQYRKYPQYKYVTNAKDE